MADLGEGTFAWVEQAELRQPGRPPRAVAVKRLRTALIEGDQELLDFVREGALLKRLRHPCAPHWRAAAWQRSLASYAAKCGFEHPNRNETRLPTPRLS